MATCFFAKFVFLCWLSAITGVLAGNRAWEPKVAEDLHNSTGSVQNHHLGKRWYIIEADPSHKLWPRGNIKVCFQARSHAHEGGVTKTTEEILRGRLEGARKLWRDAGLDDHDGWFEFEFLPVNDPLCHDESRRKEFLLVIYAGYDVEIMGTTPGKRTTLKTDVSFDKSGPSMTLSDSLEMGMKNVVANFAHEMGHAWGMHHEHQNPKWWDSLYGGSIINGKHLFGDGNFECESLSDYEAAKERVIARSKGNTETIKKNLLAMCKDQATANLFEFTGAMNWLPLQFATGPDRNVPDWDSIMIYPSDCGGKKTGSQEHLTILLKKPNGDKIKPVYKPSKLDVEGLFHMYGRAKPKWTKVLQRKSSRLFEKIYQRDNLGCFRGG